MDDAERLYRDGTELLEENPERAIELFTRSLELAPRAAPAVYNRAVALARVGRDTEALRDLKDLQNIEPNLANQLRFILSASAAGYVEIGNAEFQAGNFLGALVKYDSALAYNSLSGDAWIGKGLALEAINKLREARQCFDMALQLEPDNFYAWFSRAELNRKEGRLNDALVDYGRAIEIMPDDADAYLGRSAVHRDLNDSRAADRDKLMSERFRRQE